MWLLFCFLQNINIDHCLSIQLKLTYSLMFWLISLFIFKTLHKTFCKISVFSIFFNKYDLIIYRTINLSSFSTRKLKLLNGLKSLIAVLSCKKWGKMLFWQSHSCYHPENTGNTNAHNIISEGEFWLLTASPDKFLIRAVQCQVGI